jgi:hypothetical protein
MKLSIVLLFSIPSSTGAFLSFLDPMPVKPGLADLIDAQKELNLKINLDIGDTENAEAPHFAISGLQMVLSPDSADTYEHIKM